MKQHCALKIIHFLQHIPPLANCQLAVDTCIPIINDFIYQIQKSGAHNEATYQLDTKTLLSNSTQFSTFRAQWQIYKENQ